MYTLILNVANYKNIFLHTTKLIDARYDLNFCTLYLAHYEITVWKLYFKKKKVNYPPASEANRGVY